MSEDSPLIFRKITAGVAEVEDTRGYGFLVYVDYGDGTEHDFYGPPTGGKFETYEDAEAFMPWVAGRIEEAVREEPGCEWLSTEEIKP